MSWTSSSSEAWCTAGPPAATVVWCYSPSPPRDGASSAGSFPRTRARYDAPSRPCRRGSRPRPCGCSAPSARERRRWLVDLVKRHTQADVEDVLLPAGENRSGPRLVDVAHASPEVVDHRGERDIAPEPQVVSGAGRESPSRAVPRGRGIDVVVGEPEPPGDEKAAAPPGVHVEDRKSTRLNSSHVAISYAVFCLKKKTN